MSGMFLLFISCLECMYFYSYCNLCHIEDELFRNVCESMTKVFIDVPYIVNCDSTGHIVMTELPYFSKCDIVLFTFSQSCYSIV